MDGYAVPYNIPGRFSHWKSLAIVAFHLQSQHWKASTCPRTQVQSEKSLWNIDDSTSGYHLCMQNSIDTSVLRKISQALSSGSERKTFLMACDRPLWRLGITDISRTLKSSTFTGMSPFKSSSFATCWIIWADVHVLRRRKVKLEWMCERMTWTPNEFTIQHRSKSLCRTGPRL